MVACGANPHARDAGGCTPLHYAAYNNPVGEVAAVLFEAGVDPEACDGYGSKPLDYAVRSANAAFIEVALDAGGDAIEDARDTARYGCPSFRGTAACKRLMLTGSRLRLPSVSTRGRDED